jgi:hypothetical protein
MHLLAERFVFGGDDRSFLNEGVKTYPMEPSNGTFLHIYSPLVSTYRYKESLMLLTPPPVSKNVTVESACKSLLLRGKDRRESVPGFFRILYHVKPFRTTTGDRSYTVNNCLL